MALVDSVDKIVTAYFASVTAETFTYKGKTYDPRPLRVSPGIFRGFTCPAMCGGCCPRFSLDYLPSEPKPSIPLVERTIEFNGRAVKLLSDKQDDHAERFCRNLSRVDGRCGIHGRQPFSCDFELIRFITFKDPARANYVTQKKFGRGWAMMRIDGERGALCGITEPTAETVADNVRKLRRLDEWTTHFGLRTKLAPIIDWVASGPHTSDLIEE